MSRSYKVQIPVEILIPTSLREKEWKFNVAFSLLDILPKSKMVELLSEELKNVGFEEKESVLVKVQNPNSSISFDLESVSATVSISNISLGKTISLDVEEEVLARFQQRIDAAIKNNDVIDDSHAINLQNRVKEKAVKAMAVAVSEAKLIVNAALKNVYRDAIKEKAQNMANVTSVTETSKDGTFRIRVEMEA